MSCANCVRTVEKCLLGEDGVADVRVALLAGKAELQYNSQMVQPPELVKAVESMGYGVKILSNEKKGQLDSRKRVYHFHVFLTSGMALSNEHKESIDNKIKILPGVSKVEYIQDHSVFKDGTLLVATLDEGSRASCYIYSSLF